MKNIAIVLSVATLLSATSLHAAAGFCTTCNKVNKHNKQNPQKYKYYEDYLEAVESGKETPRDPKLVLSEIQSQN